MAVPQSRERKDRERGEAGVEGFDLFCGRDPDSGP
jgi:hypothetical protein